MTASLYPLFLNLSNRLCVVVGGSEMAEAKTRELLDAGARVHLISPEVTQRISAWAQDGFLEWKPRAYASGDLKGAFLVVSVATREVNAQVFADAEKQQTFCNAVDDIPHCSCFASAVVRRGALQIAISTAGKSPALAQRLRKELEEQFSHEYEAWVQELGEARARLFQNKAITSTERRKILHDQASAAGYESFRTRSAEDAEVIPLRTSRKDLATGVDQIRFE